jgi:hypothetical protein
MRNQPREVSEERVAHSTVCIRACARYCVSLLWPAAVASTVATPCACEMLRPERSCGRVTNGERKKGPTDTSLQRRQQPSIQRSLTPCAGAPCHFVCYRENTFDEELKSQCTDMQASCAVPARRRPLPNAGCLHPERRAGSTPLGAAVELSTNLSSCLCIWLFALCSVLVSRRQSRSLRQS